MSTTPVVSSPLVPKPPSVLTTESSKSIIDILNGDSPATSAEAIELYHSLTLELGAWCVSNLPALEQKAILAGLWAECIIEKKVEAVVMASWWGWWRCLLGWK
jgi:hypothetical protein